MSTVEIYGIKNCSTMKKATTWLTEHAIAFHFHDYKKSGIDKKTLTDWLTKAPWDALINRRGTTWRKLPDEAKVEIDDLKAIELMMANTSLIKRPVLVKDDVIYLGFSEENYHKIFDL